MKKGTSFRGFLTISCATALPKLLTNHVQAAQRPAWRAAIPHVDVAVQAKENPSQNVPGGPMSPPLVTRVSGMTRRPPLTMTPKVCQPCPETSSPWAITQPPLPT